MEWNMVVEMICRDLSAVFLVAPFFIFVVVIFHTSLLVLLLVGFQVQHRISEDTNETH